MKIVEVPPQPAGSVLPGADFADAFRIDGLAQSETAEDVARRLPHATPAWVDRLMSLRGLLVRPFGLKTGFPEEHRAKTLFPMIASSPDQVVLGMNDKHLDFRLVIDVGKAGDTNQATFTTFVKTHNPGGRLYITLIKPFHRVIVPAMMRQAFR